MRRTLVLSLALCAVPAVAGAQACLGRPERAHHGVSAGRVEMDGHSTQSLAYATRRSGRTMQVTLTEPELWKRPFKDGAWEVLGSFDRGRLARRASDSSGVRFAGNRWCLVTGMRDVRAPAGRADDGSGRELRREHLRTHVALGWGRESRGAAAGIRPFAHAGALLDYEWMDMALGGTRSRLAPAAYSQVGVGAASQLLHMSAALTYAAGAPRYTLAGQHNWMVLTVSAGVLF